MKVCLICEGRFPRIPDSAADFLRALCKNNGDTEFSLRILTNSSEEEDPKAWEIPPYIKNVETICLRSFDFSERARKVRLKAEDQQILKKMVGNRISEINKKETLDFLESCPYSPQDLVMSRTFYDACLMQYREEGSQEIFRDYLSTLRNMYYSLLEVLRTPAPEADIYHSLSCGYAGILGCAASCRTGKPLVVSECNILTRDREEEIAKAPWIPEQYKDLWVKFFQQMAYLTYQQAACVGCLCKMCREQQLELGCPEEKIRVIPMGTACASFQEKALPSILEPDCFHVGCIAPVIPSQDFKTLLLAFRILKEALPKARLTILGPYDRDPDYYQECLSLLRELQLQGVRFAGRVREENYLPQFQLMVYSGIREIQPMGVLKAMAAGKPIVCTNGGNCSELLGDSLEAPAGILVPLMDSEAMGRALCRLAEDPASLKRLGDNGKNRAALLYGEERFQKSYEDIYKSLQEGGGMNGRP